MIQDFYKVDDFIKVSGKILSPKFSENPATQSLVTLDVETELVEFEGKVVRTNLDGQVVSFQVTKSVNICNSSPPISIDVGIILDTSSLEDLHVEHLTV
jgi:hypothetical protein